MNATWRYVASALPPAVTNPADLAHFCPVADVIELRLDALCRVAPQVSVAQWVRACARPVLATVRSLAEGGQHAGPPEQAARWLTEAARAGARWIDTEHSVAGLLPDSFAGCERLLSRHAPFEEVAPAEQGELCKRAGPVGDARALAALRAWAGRRAARTTLVPYGPLSGLRAALAPGPQGEAFLFGAADARSPAAPGQLPLAALLDELRAGEVGLEAECFGLLGDPPAWSLSPALHNAVFRGEQRAALYLPLPGLSPREALDLGFRGFSVTTPFKGEATSLASAHTPEVRATGATNTLVALAGGGWQAHNTDVQALRQHIPPASPGAQALVYGAGGFARAAAFVLGERGYAVRIAARRPQAAAELAAQRGVAHVADVPLRQPRDAVWVNATASGVDGQIPSFVQGDALQGLTVLDAPVASRWTITGWVKAAQQGGAACVVEGEALLRAQAQEQARCFGARAPDVILDAWMRWAAAPPRTLALMGLRGSGKSTVGRRLATLAGRPFVDLDQEVRRASGRWPTEWIESAGWEAFRDVEQQVLGTVLARAGVVLALGGGTVERATCRESLAAGTWRVWLHIEPEQAAQRVAQDPTPRPPWPGSHTPAEEAQRLQQRRAPLWNALANCVLDASAGVQEVARAALVEWTRLEQA